MINKVKMLLGNLPTPLRKARILHLFIDISSHGLGHLAITAPVLNALAKIAPNLRLTAAGFCGGVREALSAPATQAELSAMKSRRWR